VTRYILQRIGQSVITVWGISIVVFLLAHFSGDPLLLLVPPEATLAEVEQIRRSYGLDKSLPEQYVTFMRGVLRGDFGTSLRFDEPTLPLVLERIPASLKLALAAMALSLSLGITIGVFSAARPGGLVDRFGKLFAMLGQSVPVFWLGIMLILIFAVRLRWFPTSGDATWKHIVLPALTLGWYSTSAVTRITRSAMLDVLDADYIRLAHIKGLHPFKVMTKHALRNAAIPIVTLASLQFIALINGAVVTETIFAWPGMGRLTVDAVFARDFPLVQTAVFVASVLFVLTNLAVDLLYGVLNPRISYA
jgi:peptide/nickel transport system permease protein